VKLANKIIAQCEVKKVFLQGEGDLLGDTTFQEQIMQGRPTVYATGL
jgi:hypothetical protein